MDTNNLFTLKPKVESLSLCLWVRSIVPWGGGSTSRTDFLQEIFMFALVALSVRNESFLDRHKKVFLCSVCCCCCWRHFSPATTLLKANKTNFNKSTHRAWLSKGAESNSTPLYLPPPLLPNPFVVQPVLVVALQTLHTVCAFLCGNMGQRKGATSVSNDTIRVRPEAQLGMQIEGYG